MEPGDKLEFFLVFSVRYNNHPIIINMKSSLIIILFAPLIF